jgi:hypothetical protein
MYSYHPWVTRSPLPILHATQQSGVLTVEPLYKDTPHKDNRVSKDMDQGPDDICM